MSVSQMKTRIFSNTNGVGTHANSLCGSTLTWADGTPKSFGNAFDLAPRSVQTQVDKRDAKRAWQREYERKKYHAKKAGDTNATQH